MKQKQTNYSNNVAIKEIELCSSNIKFFFGIVGLFHIVFGIVVVASYFQLYRLEMKCLAWYTCLTNVPIENHWCDFIVHSDSLNILKRFNNTQIKRLFIIHYVAFLKKYKFKTSDLFISFVNILCLMTAKSPTKLTHNNNNNNHLTIDFNDQLLSYPSNKTT